MKKIKIISKNKVLAAVFELACYCVLLAPVQLMSQSLVAQYPLFMHEFNRHFLYLSYWDVSGNRLHGHTYNPYACTGYANGGRLGLYFENEPSPDKDPTKVFKLKQGFFYETDEKVNIPCLKKNIGDDAYVTIPDPLPNYPISFSISFWIKPESSNDTKMYIYQSQNFVIRLNNNYLEVFHCQPFKSASNVNVYRFDNSILSSDKWQFVVVNKDYNGLFHAKTASNPSEITELTSNFTYQELYTPVVNTYKSKILDNSFGGQVYNFRFYMYMLPDIANSIQQDLNFLHKNCVNASGSVLGANYIIDNAICYYPLNGNNFSEWQKNYKGSNAYTCMGNILSATDRFDNINGALNFSGISSMTLAYSNNYIFKDYFSGYNPFIEPVTPDANGNCGNFTNPKGISFSFWMNITENLSSPKSIENYQLPFTDSDPKYTIFTAQNANRQDLYGLQRIKDRLGLFRVTRIQGKPIDPWYLWCYDPVNFTNKQGWYHIVLSQDMDWLKLYVFKPGESTPIIQALYMELDRLDEVTAWMLGSTTNNGPGIIDDFRVYNWPLYDTEVIALHQIESKVPSSALKSNIIKDLTVLPDSVNGILPSFSVYPNPATNKLYVKIVLSKKADVQLSLCDFKGIPLLSDAMTFDAGVHEFPIKINSFSRGVYLLKVITTTDSYTEKVIIQ